MISSFIAWLVYDTKTPRLDRPNVLLQENDWVYVISEENQEGFIPHSYCAQFGSQLATLALNVKKKLPRNGGDNAAATSMSMSPVRYLPKAQIYQPEVEDTRINVLSLRYRICRRSIHNKLKRIHKMGRNINMWRRRNEKYKGTLRNDENVCKETISGRWNRKIQTELNDKENCKLNKLS